MAPAPRDKSTQITGGKRPDTLDLGIQLSIIAGHPKCKWLGRRYGYAAPILAHTGARKHRHVALGYRSTGMRIVPLWSLPRSFCLRALSKLNRSMLPISLI
jgi:hypothetical protein